MEGLWNRSGGGNSGRIIAGLLFTATLGLPQAYTISAKPGAVNYVEGTAYLDGARLSDKAIRATFLGANDTLSTDVGKAELLLSPGVFLRIGSHSEVRMISPSLVNTQVELSRGEAMIEVTGLVKDNTVRVIDRGASITIDRDGLYRFTADDPATVAVLDGKASLNSGEREVRLGKGREILIGESLKTEKFDTKREDDLYAWSNIRSEYDAAASYQAAKSVGANSFSGWGGYGYSGFTSPGWYWASGFDSWAWLPASGAFYSPFGYGFYAPGVVAYAPVVFTPIYTGGNGGTVNGNRGPWNGHWSGRGTNAAVPVNPDRPAAVGRFAASPAANQAARAQAAQSFAATGFHSATGAPVATYAGPRITGFSNAGQLGVAHAGEWSGAGQAAAGGTPAAAHQSPAGAPSGHSGGGHSSSGPSRN